MKVQKLKSAVVAIALAYGLPAWAAWPDDKPIEVVVGFAAGGGTDLMARKLLPFVQKRLGPKAQFVVQNKPGAAGEIANAYVKNAKPDGYTLAVVNVPGFLFVPMTKKSQYQASDFQLISRVVDDPTIVITKSDNKVTSFQALLAALKQNPGSSRVRPQRHRHQRRPRAPAAERRHRRQAQRDSVQGHGGAEDRRHGRTPGVRPGQRRRSARASRQRAPDPSARWCSSRPSAPPRFRRYRRPPSSASTW